MESNLEIRRNADLKRFELVEGEDIVGIADYRLVDGTVVFPHTVVDPRRRGQGLGAVLVRGALEQVRREGRRVEPRCWYVAQFIDEHPEYRDLLAAA